MTYAAIDLRERTMTYARAGHTPLMYLPGPGCSDPRRIQVLAPDGLVLGLKLDSGEMFDRLLEESTIKLNPGDLFVFYTDGISEAMNEGDDCFGETRLGQLVEAHAHLPSAELCLPAQALLLLQLLVLLLLLLRRGRRGRGRQLHLVLLILLKIDEAAVASTPTTEAMTSAGRG